MPRSPRTPGKHTLNCPILIPQNQHHIKPLSAEDVKNVFGETRVFYFLFVAFPRFLDGPRRSFITRNGLPARF